MTRSLLFAAAAALIGLAPAAAQPVDVADFDALFDAPPRVEVNLRGSLLRLAAEAARAEEPEAAGMLDGLRAVTVRIYSTASARRAAVDRIDAFGSQFEADDWLPLVRVRSLPDDEETDGDVWVYVRDLGDSFGGMAVMAVDEEEGNTVFVLIDGTISPDQVGALSRQFADVDIDGRGDEEGADREADQDEEDDDQ